MIYRTIQKLTVLGLILVLISDCKKNEKKVGIGQIGVLIFLASTPKKASSTCSTTIEGATTFTVGTPSIGTIGRGDACFFKIVTSTADAFKFSVTGTDSNSVLGTSAPTISVAYAGIPTTLDIFSFQTVSTSTTYVGSIAELKTAGSTTPSSISVYNPINTTRYIGIRGFSCEINTGCTYSLTATALNLGTTSCTTIGNSVLTTDTASLSTKPFILLESGSTLTGLSAATGNYCNFRLVSKTATTNSFLLSGLTSNLELYVGSDRGPSSFNTASITAGTANETLNSLSISEGSIRNILVGATACAAGSCPFTLSVSSP